MVLLTARPALAAPHDEVTIETVKTSIYVGSVTLHVPPMKREQETYHTTYRAKVFPYWFHNEHGTLSINLSDADLARLEAGETVEFTGHALNHKGQGREVTGRAQPQGDRHGKLKVRVRVTEKIELIFNTTYTFTGK